MALKYDYQAYLEVDDDTYNGWQGKLEDIETTSIRKFKQLANNYESSKNYQQEFDYCKEKIFINLFGDDLTANMFNFHNDNVYQIEDEIKYSELDVIA